MSPKQTPKQILVTGAKHGQVGWELCRTLSTLGNVIAVDQADADFTKPEELKKLVHSVHPDIIVNAAAYTAVDKAESEPELAMAINGIAPGVLAKAGEECGAIFVHYSTDYIFDGTNSNPYTEEDLPNPQNVYGQTKLAGENSVRENSEAHFIFRTSWVYGSRGKNFLLTMLKLGMERDHLNIVSDQIGAPTWSRTIAEATAQVLIQTLSSADSRTWGTYNLTNREATSWHGFAEAIFNQFAEQAKGSPFCIPVLNAISTAQYPTPAVRPKNSRLDCYKLCDTFNLHLPTWKKALSLCLEELKLSVPVCC